VFDLIVPPDEAERVRSLREHGDLPQGGDPHFDIIAEIAAHQHAMPMAEINLVGADTVQTCAAFGMPAPTAMPRNLAFCAHTILSSTDLTIVADTHLDARFASNPRSLDPGIRFYAGAPLTDQAGHALGALCVMDMRPRAFDENAANALARLARIASDRLGFYRLKSELRQIAEHHRNTVELSPQVFWTANPQGAVDAASPRWFDLVGLPPEQALGHGWASCVHPDDAAAAFAQWAECLPSGRSLDVEYRLRLKDGHYSWFRARAYALRDAHGAIIRWYGTLEDHNDRKLTRLALQESERRLRFALESGKLGTWEVDFQTGRLAASDQCARDLGLRHADELLHYDTLLDLLHPQDRPLYDEALGKCLATGDYMHVECRNIWRDGTIHWVRLTGRPVYTEEGKPSGAVGTSLDITERQNAEDERRAAEARMIHLANHDPVTDLANAHLLYASIAAALKQASTASHLALLHIDIDDFKAINDSLGQDAGDHVLLQAAACLRGCARDADVVAHTGGGEFAVLAPGLPGREDAESLARSILHALAQPAYLGARAITLSACVGIALAPDDAVLPDQLRKDAATALYRSKSIGHGSIHFFEPEMDLHLQAREALKLELRDALERQELRLFYQPLVDLRTGRTGGFEALMRWQHPERGMVSPADFIPVAEETGWIVGFGRWAVMAACMDAVRWPEPVSVAVNFSVMQFSAGTVEEDVAEALARSGLPANRLEVEVVESLLLSHSDANLGVLNRLHAMGVRIVMDDFGTGYSSLSTLRRFPFDKIKLDQSLMVGVPDNAGGDAIVEGVSGLGKALRVRTLAEGVETTAQCDLVRQMGYHYAQGYLFSRPVPGPEAHALAGKTWVL
jgi:diguanylate cyclase (GGDEF)-like protein/PAS domain S-box-containing protein